MTKNYVIKRNGVVVGLTTDRLLAERIDGMEISNDASDPAYRETYEYEVER